MKIEKAIQYALLPCVALSRGLRTLGCPKLDSCYLVNLDSLDETKLVQDGKNLIDMKDSTSFSVRCDTDGTATIGQIQFSADAQNTHTEKGAPYWMNGDSEGWINRVSQFRQPGMTDLTVAGSTSGLPCFSHSFEIELVDGMGTRTTPAPSPPVATSLSDSWRVFNKIPGAFRKMTMDDYPMRGEVGKRLQKESTGDSIILLDDFELKGQSPLSFIEAAGGEPPRPGTPAFWDEFRKVMEVQIDRNNKKDVNEYFTLPMVWEGFSMEDAADAVKKEYPGLWQQQVIEWAWGQGIEIDYKLIPFRSKVDFIGKVIRMVNINAWAIGTVAPMNFHIKWHIGMPRPEEIAWGITTGDIKQEDVPEDIYFTIKAMQLKNQFDFGAYKDVGSPKHPSWPAMHSAASVASLWLAVLADNITDEIYCEALRTDYAVAFGRTVGGVHYEMDNTAGLNIGQETLRRNLADFLVVNYNGDRAYIEKKIEKFTHDWRKFDSATCTTSK